MGVGWYLRWRQKEARVQEHIVARLPGRTARCQDRPHMAFEFQRHALIPIMLPDHTRLCACAFLLYLMGKIDMIAKMEL